MKKSINLIALVLLSFSSLLAQSSDGIQFKSEAWAEILEEAAKQQKMIFVDAYTTWCGPCKKMSREIFPDKMVGEFYNASFINVKLDMEKGEGPGLAQKYNVFVYPSLLFLDSDGSLVHRSAGYHDIDQFLDLGEKALDPSRRLSAMEDRYNNGDRSANFLHAYTLARFEIQDGTHGEIAEQYLKTQENWAEEDNMRFILSFVTSTDSKMFDYILDNRASFDNIFSQTTVNARVDELIHNSLYQGGENSLEQADALFKKAYPNNSGQMSMKYRMTHYRQLGDREGYAKAAVAYMDEYIDKSHADDINETAWTFYRVVEDKKLLKKAVKWSKKSIKMDDSFYNNDTLAALYKKLGKKKCAKKTAIKAIELAKNNNEDASETEKLLEEIMAM